jgi:hypothetical protein
MVLNIKVWALWDVIPCSLIGISVFQDNLHPHLQGRIWKKHASSKVSNYNQHKGFPKFCNLHPSIYSVWKVSNHSKTKASPFLRIVLLQLCKFHYYFNH